MCIGGGNGAGDAAVLSLAATLQAGACPRLNQLDIGGNGAGDAAVSSLAAALQAGACPQLQQLACHHCTHRFCSNFGIFGFKSAEFMAMYKVYVS